MQVDEGIGIVPMAARMRSPVDHDHGSIRLGQDDVAKLMPTAPPPTTT